MDYGVTCSTCQAFCWNLALISPIACILRIFSSRKSSVIDTLFPTHFRAEMLSSNTSGFAEAYKKSRHTCQHHTLRRMWEHSRVASAYRKSVLTVISAIPVGIPADEDRQKHLAKAHGSEVCAL